LLFAKSFDDVYALRPHQLQLGFLKLLAGSPMEAMIDVHGYKFSDHPPYEIISNKYITNSEIIFLKQFEDCFNKFYNSGRFNESLQYINTFFFCSYDMYKDITSYFENNGLAFKSLSSRNLYDVLFSYAKSNIRGIDMEKLTEKLLFDYFSSDQSDTVPMSLRNAADFSKEAKKLIKDALSNLSLKPGPVNTGRFINGKCYFFDYSIKDPVTDRYSFYKGF
jgi:hypothetical protein